MANSVIVSTDIDKKVKAIAVGSGMGKSGSTVSRASNAQTAPQKPAWTALLVLGSITASFGGLMFGYEIGIAGGAIGMDPFLVKFFPAIYSRKTHTTDTQFCKFNEGDYQIIVSSLFLVGAFVSLTATFVQSKIGRKGTMLVSSFFFLGGCALLAFAKNVAMIVLGRVAWGFCMGLSNSAVPLYLSEIAPSSLRGTLNILFQLCTTIGIWAANLINWAITSRYGNPENGWRYAFGGAVVPAVMVLFGTLLVPDTPQSLLHLGKPDKARDVLQRLRGPQTDISDEFAAMQEEHEHVLKHTPSQLEQYRLFGRRQYFPLLVILIVMPFFQQFTGANGIEFYSNQLFDTVGIKDAFFNTMIINAIFCMCTIPSIVLVDRVGRRTLLKEGAVQMIVSHIFMCWLIATGWTSSTKLGADFAIFFMCLFIAAYAWSWAPVIWLIPTEILPLEVRSVGVGISTFSNFIFSFVIGQWYQDMQCGMQSGVYLWWAFWCTVMLLFAIFALPETRQTPLAQVAQNIRAHPLWSRFYTKPSDAAAGTAKTKTAHSTDMGAAVELGTPLHAVSPMASAEDPPESMHQFSALPRGSPASPATANDREPLNAPLVGRDSIQVQLPQAAHLK